MAVLTVRWQGASAIAAAIGRGDVANVLYRLNRMAEAGKIKHDKVPQQGTPMNVYRLKSSLQRS